LVLNSSDDRRRQFNIDSLTEQLDPPSAKSAREFYMDGCRIIASIIIPPVGVFMRVGLGWEFWLNVLLSLLGYVPGLVHAIWVIARKD
jgi:uncharacterized membrane protein YqaE (UPF0057 family)